MRATGQGYEKRREQKINWDTAEVGCKKKDAHHSNFLGKAEEIP
jgi:hypothetical protein